MLLRNIMIGVALGLGLGLINQWLAVALGGVIFMALCVLTLIEREPSPRLHISTPRRRIGSRSARR